MKGSGKLLVVLCSAALSIAGCLSSPVSGPQPPPPEAPASGSPATEAPEEKPAEFVVTDDVYRKTFQEIQQLVETLDRSIREKNFDEWASYLSPEYAARVGSAEFLQEASRSGVLNKRGITLQTVKDYFLYVVVPSRSGANLEEISFVDETHVKAITLVDERPVILYWLVRSDARWKIGIW